MKLLSCLLFILAFSALAMERPINSTQIGMKALEVSVVTGTNATAQTIAPKTFDVALTSTTTDQITTTATHSYVLGDRIRLTGTGSSAVPAGTSTGTDYFVIPISTTELQLAASLADAVAGTPVDLTTTGSGTIYSAIVEMQEVKHGFITGDHVRLTTTGTLPSGLALATDYWIIADSANKFRFASSLANALAGTAVNWVSALTDDAGTQVTATQVEKLDGPAKNKFTLQCQSTGVYKLSFTESGLFYSTSKMTGFVSPRTADITGYVSAYDKTYITISTRSVAASPAATNGTFDLLVLGSRSDTFY